MQKTQSLNIPNKGEQKLSQTSLSMGRLTTAKDSSPKHSHSAADSHQHTSRDRRYFYCTSTRASELDKDQQGESDIDRGWSGEGVMRGGETG